MPIDFTAIKPELEKAKNILVLLPANPDMDNVAAGLGLYLSLKKQGKSVSIICPTAMTVGFNRLVGVNKITDKAGNRNLIVSFPYQEDTIEKVSYNIEDNKFNLVIEPKTGQPGLDADKVEYNYSGGVDADLLLVIGALKADDLGSFYEAEKKLFEERTVVNLNNQSSSFGKINLVDEQATSLSEMAALLIKSMGYGMDPDIATNFYSGLKTGSQNFQSNNTNANTFELAAWLLTNGAKKDYLEQVSQSGSLGQNAVSMAVSAPALSTAPLIQPAPAAAPTSAPGGLFTGRPLDTAPAVKPLTPLTVPEDKTPDEQPDIKAETDDNLTKPPFTDDGKQDDSKVQPPPDWFKPKIYSGGSK